MAIQHGDLHQVDVVEAGRIALQVEVLAGQFRQHFREVPATQQFVTQ